MAQQLKPLVILRCFLIASLLIATVGCSMFQRDKLTVRKDDAPQKAVAVSTGMAFIEVERLLGKPSKISKESCRVNGETVECRRTSEDPSSRTKSKTYFMQIASHGSSGTLGGRCNR